MPSQVGVSLITVLPEQLQSPLLTAEWEHRLKEVERGELSPGAFMDCIAEGVKELVQSYEIIPGALCGLIAAVVVSKLSKAPGADVEELFDRAVAYRED